jgi:Protein of unknown function (DUF1097)
METETKETIPLWLAVAITVVVSLPFGLWIDNIGGDLNLMNLPLWVAFIVWAEYFALGAKPGALLTIIPSFVLAVILTAAAIWAYVWLNDQVIPADWPEGTALAIALFVGVGAMVYIMRFSPTLQAGSLPYFNGISMLLAVYFTNSIPAGTDAYLAPWLAALMTVLGGLLGAFLGWFNVTITFPHPVAPAAQAPGGLAAQH